MSLGIHPLPVRVENGEPVGQLRRNDVRSELRPCRIGHRCSAKVQVVFQHRCAAQPCARQWPRHLAAPAGDHRGTTSNYTKHADNIARVHTDKLAAIASEASGLTWEVTLRSVSKLASIGQGTVLCRACNG